MNQTRRPVVSVIVVAAIAILGFAASVKPQIDCTFNSQNATRTDNLASGADMPENCNEGFIGWTRSYHPVLGSPSYVISPPGCDPNLPATSCTIGVVIHSDTPGNHQNGTTFGPPISAEWYNSGGSLVGQCGVPVAPLFADSWDAKMSVGFSCSSGMSGVPDTDLPGVFRTS